MEVTRDKGSIVAIGLGLSAFSPDDFEIRMLGHR